MTKFPEPVADVFSADTPIDDRSTPRVCSDRQEGSFGDHASRRHHPEPLVGHSLCGKKQEDASDDRNKLPPQYRRGQRQQLADLRDDVAGSHQEGYAVGQPNPGECGQRIALQTRDPDSTRPPPSCCVELTGRVHDGDELGRLYRSRSSGRPYAWKFFWRRKTVMFDGRRRSEYLAIALECQ